MSLRVAVTPFARDSYAHEVAETPIFARDSFVRGVGVTPFARDSHARTAMADTSLASSGYSCISASYAVASICHITKLRC
jgi:hypothetical protein